MQQANKVNKIYREAAAMQKLDHKNIVGLNGAFVLGKEVVMIMEYCSGGELLDFVQLRGKLPEAEARDLIHQIVSAMSYCHNRGIVHRDLKLENVLFKTKGENIVKVADFGIAGVSQG